MAASVRFCGRDIPLGSNDPKALERDSNQGRLLQSMTDAALPQSAAHARQLQQLRAAQAKQERDEERAVARLISQEEQRYER